MKTLHYADPQPGATGYGWATANRELKKALAHYFITDEGFLPDVVFMPVDSAFRPLSKWRGKINVCLNFFESPLEAEAKANADKFDLCFVGSTWCKERCAEAGIHHTAVLLQGVDSAVFAPHPPRAPDGTIRVFSGGKFEYRKGQDLVIAAFREFVKAHPTAHLVCAWHNPWPQLFSTMANSPWFNPLAHGATQLEFFASLLCNNGIPRENFTILPQLSQPDLARAMASTDFGLFPNRCEGGTNLVLMEYAACRRPIVANVLTGHMDVSQAITVPILAYEDEKKWAVQSVDHIVRAMNIFGITEFYEGWEAPSWTWEAAAKTVFSEIERLTA